MVEAPLELVVQIFAYSSEASIESHRIFRRVRCAPTLVPRHRLFSDSNPYCRFHRARKTQP